MRGELSSPVAPAGARRARPGNARSASPGVRDTPWAAGPARPSRPRRPRADCPRVCHPAVARRAIGAAHDIMPPNPLGHHPGVTAFAFRGYNVTNLGRTPELLDHPAYGPVVRAALSEGGA